VFHHASVTHSELDHQLTMDLFSGVHYFLSPSFSSQRIAELSHVLEINGATRAESIDDNALTHFITNSNGFERWQDVTAREEAGQVSVITVSLHIGL
jgi:hypothetical protein